jgi:hypothetical protein
MPGIAPLSLSMLLIISNYYHFIPDIFFSDPFLEIRIGRGNSLEMYPA